jgi:hypothetical protein
MEQVPLLAQEEAPAEPDAPKRGKVWIKLCLHVILIW